MMLRGNTFKTLQTKDPAECTEACHADDKCQSINYVMSNGMCELNDRTKEARPVDFVADMDRPYVRRWADRGRGNLISVSGSTSDSQPAS